MLTINKEFRKGILFVRLLGVLNKDTVNKLYDEVTILVRDMKINNVVFNIEELDIIDIYGINEILLNYKLCKQNNGISMLCGVNSNIKEIIDNSPIRFIAKINNELKALDLVKI